MQLTQSGGLFYFQLSHYLQLKFQFSAATVQKPRILNSCFSYAPGKALNFPPICALPQGALIVCGRAGDGVNRRLNQINCGTERTAYGFS